jgi:dihydrofolate reductase
MAALEQFTRFVDAISITGTNYKRRFRMARLIYSAISSLDGYTEDMEGNFDWAAPDEEVHRFINNLERTAGTYLYGRRMYETLMVWETDPNLAADSPITRDFAEIWQAANKIVYSRTLQAASTRKTQLERNFDPEAIRQLKETVEQDILIGGPELAAHAFRAGLIDECHLFLTPIIVGGGKQCLPDNVRLELELLEERRFGNGVVFLRYRTRQGRTT